MNISNVVETKKCVGCMTCKGICPVKAVDIKLDDEGFYVPHINIKKCVECGKCGEICPIINKSYNKSIGKQAYIFQNRDELIREQSSSGGFFSAVAKYVIDNGGIVYGAAFDSDWKVNHIGVDNLDDLALLRGSKYVQSDMTVVFSSIRQELISGRLVCFSGTPCQVAGVANFVGKKYNNLILIDVVCHGVGSPELWRRYISDVKFDLSENISTISFRSKIYGYAASTMMLTAGDKKYVNGKNIQSYKMLFFKGYNLRSNCYLCDFKGEEKMSDLTIYDCWHVNLYNKKWDDDKGTSSVLVNTEQGKAIIRELYKKHNMLSVDRNKLIRSDGDMLYNCVAMPHDIEDYKMDFKGGKSISGLIDRYCPYDIKKQLKLIFKPILAKFKLLKLFRK